MIDYGHLQCNEALLGPMPRLSRFTEESLNLRITLTPLTKLVLQTK